VFDWAGVLSGPIGVVMGVGGTKLLSRKKDSAEAAQIIASTAVLLVEPLQKQITDLTTRMGAVETENNLTKTKLQLAIEHIRALRSWIANHIPDKQPPPPPLGLGL
jgi:hypothetical protein